MYPPRSMRRLSSQIATCGKLTKTRKMPIDRRVSGSIDVPIRKILALASPRRFRSMHVRACAAKLHTFTVGDEGFSKGAAGGAEGNRTPDLCSAIAALSHLSYSPAAGPGRPGGA